MLGLRKNSVFDSWYGKGMYATCEELEDLKTRLNQVFEDVSLYVLGEDREALLNRTNCHLTEIANIVPGVEYTAIDRLALLFADIHCDIFEYWKTHRHEEH